MENPMEYTSAQINGILSSALIGAYKSLNREQQARSAQLQGMIHRGFSPSESVLGSGIKPGLLFKLIGCVPVRSDDMSALLGHQGDMHRWWLILDHMPVWFQLGLRGEMIQRQGERISPRVDLRLCRAVVEADGENNRWTIRHRSGHWVGLESGSKQSRIRAYGPRCWIWMSTSGVMTVYHAECRDCVKLARRAEVVS
jgi:hypothetical protein